MKNHPVDRRVQRTRSLLSDALVSLILEKGYPKITVQNIIDRANVGRSTFYDHFQDKEDLLEKSFGSVMSDLHHDVESEHHHDDGEFEHVFHSLDFFNHAYNNRKLHKAMAESGGGEILFEIGRQHIELGIQAHIKEMGINEKDLPIPLSMVTHTIAGTLLSILKWWVEEDAPYTPEEMNAMFNQLIMPGVSQALNIRG